VEAGVGFRAAGIRKAREADCFGAVLSQFFAYIDVHRSLTDSIIRSSNSGVTEDP
jgi:hypothetical protein